VEKNMLKDEQGYNAIMVHQKQQWTKKLKQNLAKLEEEQSMSNEISQLKQKVVAAKEKLNDDRIENEER